MIAYRSFRNEDPPRLADVWRTADLGPSAIQPMTTSLLETAVFSKPYFEREGLAVAVDGERVVGFAHAGFGPNVEGTALDRRRGSTLLVAVVPHPDQDEIARGLLGHTERYLESRGATELLGGGSADLRGFYLGLYGGADLPGILDSSGTMRRLFEQSGYVPAERIVVLRRQLADYRPPVNRLQLAIRRKTRLHAIDEPSRRTWWEAATTTGIGLRRYELRSNAEEVLGSGSFWDMQPLADSWGIVAAGLLRVDIEGTRRREGLAHYLVSEAMQDLAKEGVVMVETQVAESNAPALRLFHKLGFEATERGTIYRRASSTGG